MNVKQDRHLRVLSQTRLTAGRRHCGKEVEIEQCGKLKSAESADKPGSVVGNHSSGTGVTTGLVRPTRRHRGPRHRLPIWSCSGWGLPSHSVLPPVRCALTAPFHPYHAPKCGRYPFCCTFRRLAPPRRYLAPCPMEPGLSSPDRSRERLPGQLRPLLSVMWGVKGMFWGLGAL